LFAGANGSYTKAQDDSTKTDLLRRPRRSITVTSGYQQASWGISAEVLGKSHAADSYGRLPGYAVANVQGYWQVIPSTKLRLSVENIGDKVYGSAYALSNVRYLATPLSASLSAEVKF
jgi:vitamin B12 transporter